LFANLVSLKKPRLEESKKKSKSKVKYKWFFANKNCSFITK
jgi:hypothetical protein